VKSRTDPFKDRGMDWHDFEKQDRWITALEDERPALRSSVLEILSDLATPPAEAVKPALRQVDKYGWHEAFQFPHMITKLPHTEESLAWLAARLRALAPRTGVDNELMHLSGWFCDAPLGWLKREIDGFVETLTGAPEPGSPGVRSQPVVFRSGGASFDKAVNRLILAQLSSEDLGKRANTLLERCAGKETFPHKEIRELELIAKTLADRGECPREAAGEWLDLVDPSPENEVGVDEYRAGYALMLLREARMAAPLEKLLGVLDLDWDWTNELYQDALSAGADAGTIAELLEIYPTLEWYQRLFSSGCIEKCWRPENEAAVMRAAKNEDAPDLETSLAGCLILCGSAEAREYARRVARETPDQPECRSILEHDSVRSIVRGEDTEEDWKILEHMEREHQRFRQRLGLLDFKKLPQTRPDSDPKIGRNDPCPCGSGKKYKKCCG
jgi:hypothetical protein